MLVTPPPPPPEGFAAIPHSVAHFDVKQPSAPSNAAFFPRHAPALLDSVHATHAQSRPHAFPSSQHFVVTHAVHAEVSSAHPHAFGFAFAVGQKPVSVEAAADAVTGADGATAGVGAALSGFSLSRFAPRSQARATHDPSPRTRRSRSRWTKKSSPSRLRKTVTPRRGIRCSE